MNEEKESKLESFFKKDAPLIRLEKQLEQIAAKKLLRDEESIDAKLEEAVHYLKNLVDRDYHSFKRTSEMLVYRIEQEISCYTRSVSVISRFLELVNLYRTDKEHTELLKKLDDFCSGIIS